jgi:DNA-binding response OmpR family regulator
MRSNHILIIDDNEPICEALAIILEMEGFKTTTCLTGKNALMRIRDINPDLILLDLMLDGFDGRDICKEVKSQAETSHIPIIMISASHKLSDTTKISCHPDSFIQKPFDLDFLVSTVHQYIS